MEGGDGFPGKPIDDECLMGIVYTDTAVKDSFHETLKDTCGHKTLVNGEEGGWGVGGNDQ